MKKSLIFAFSFLFIFSILFIGALGDYQNNKVGIRIENKGWHLIPYFAEIDCNVDTELCETDILVEYTYIPTLEKYYTNDELNSLSELENNLFMEFINKEGTTPPFSKWIYVKESGVGKWIGYSAEPETSYQGFKTTDRNDLSEIKLFKGWNFLTITPSMSYENEIKDELKIKEVLGSCVIDKIYLFNPQKQDWVEMTLEDDFDAKMLGLGFIMKPQKECYLGLKEEVVTVPSIPN